MEESRGERRRAALFACGWPLSDQQRGKVLGSALPPLELDPNQEVQPSRCSLVGIAGSDASPHCAWTAPVALLMALLFIVTDSGSMTGRR